MSKFLEIKRHLNKPDERYDCELIRKEPDHVVLKYISDRVFESAKLRLKFPPGCVTLAEYWRSRPYAFWTILSPAGELIGYLVHICRGLKIFEDSLDYLDMLLDVWFYPDGRHVVLDKDEVKQCIDAGCLTKADAKYIDAAKEEAIRDFPRNAAEAKKIASALDISGRAQ
jgi:hypothetical protein